MITPISAKDQRFLQMAAGVATQSKCRFRHGCVLVKHGKILSASPNIFRNNVHNMGDNWAHSSIHSEIATLKRAGFPRRATLFVARINASGEIRISKPCYNCQEVIDGLHCKVLWTE